MAWEVTRNSNCNDAAAGSRVGQLLALINDELQAHTTAWTVQGSGDGTANGDMTGTDYLSAFPAVAADLSWICLQNDDGAEIVIQRNGSALDTFFSPSGGYTSGMGETATARVGTSSPPADEVTGPSSTNFGSTGTFYASIAVEIDSFILFSKTAANLERAIIFAKLDDSKTGDTTAYWLWCNGVTGSSTPWLPGSMRAPGNFGRGYHPTAGDEPYGVPEFLMDTSTDPMDTAPLDPVTGNAQLHECACVCAAGANEHMRGTVPGLVRCSGSLSVGDRLDSGAYVCFGDFGVPWGTLAVALL